MEAESRRVSRAVCFTVLLLQIVVLTACAASREKLGSGYTLVTRRVESASTFERYAYRDFLHYRHRHLGEVGFFSLSPTGRFALYEQDGALMLFDTSEGEPSDVTDGEFSVPKFVRWDEAGGVATIEYFDSHDPTKVTLQ